MTPNSKENFTRYSIRKEFEAAKSREAQLSLIRHLVADVKEQLATSATNVTQARAPNLPHVYYGPSSTETVSCTAIKSASRKQYGNARFLPVSRPTKLFVSASRADSRGSQLKSAAEDDAGFADAYLPGKQIGSVPERIGSKSIRRRSRSSNPCKAQPFNNDEIEKLVTSNAQIKPGHLRLANDSTVSTNSRITTDFSKANWIANLNGSPDWLGQADRSGRNNDTKRNTSGRSERLLTDRKSYHHGEEKNTTTARITLNKQLKSELITCPRQNRTSKDISKKVSGTKTTETKAEKSGNGKNLLEQSPLLSDRVDNAQLLNNNGLNGTKKASAADLVGKPLRENPPPNANTNYSTKINRKVETLPPKPVTIKYFTDQGLTPLLCAFRNLNWKDYANKGRWNMFWGNVNTARALYQPGQRHYFTDDQLVNHFPSCYQLSRKDNMTKNIKKYRNDLHHAKDPLARKDKQGNFLYLDLIAPTYLLPFDFNTFVNEFRKHGGLWIVKPCNGSQGQGIYLVNQLEQAKRWQERAIAEVASSVQDNEAYQGFLISRYIANPLLIDGKKFDLRLYVLVTSFKPLRCYYYRQGFCRFCSKRYSPDSATIDDKFMHLTNVAIQKQKTDYNQWHGNKWNVKTFRLYLERVFGRGRTDGLFDRIFWMIVQSLKAAQPLMDNERHCYEMYGYDCLIDAHLKPWLLEINASPSLEESTPIDRINKTNLLVDTMKMAMYERCPNLIGMKEKRSDGSDMPLGDYEILYLEPPGPRLTEKAKKDDSSAPSGRRDTSIQGRPRWNI